jgi:hypothetical protein
VNETKTTLNHENKNSCKASSPKATLWIRPRSLYVAAVIGESFEGCQGAVELREKRREPFATGKSNRRVCRPHDRDRLREVFSRSHHAVIRVYDEAGNVIETHEHAGEFKEW